MSCRSMKTARASGSFFPARRSCYLLTSLFPFAMAIHELTTNALKYGALSVLAGVLRVSWTLDETRLVLRWEESNVPIKRQPTRVGFGSQLLQRLLPHQLGARVEMK